jgi:hypothetical protein
MPRFYLQLQLTAAICLATAACGTDSGDTTGTKDPTLTVRGSGAVAPAGIVASSSLQTGTAPNTSADVTSGNPSSLTLTVYSLYIGRNDDCSGLQLVQDYGTVGQPKDFMQNPVLFSASPASGAYKCVAFKMSDVIKMKPAASFGACVAGTEYVGDIYRAGESDWKDADLNTIVGHGTDEVPADDHVTLFLARNSAAARARGISQHQVIDLSSDLVVPALTTFYWDATGTVRSEGGQCGIYPGKPSFH